MPQTYEMDLVSLIEKFNSEDACRAYLEQLRWPDGAKCPRCGSDKTSNIHKREQFDCDSCRYQFSVTSGTIMHDTHLPLWKWFLAVYMMVESKKGVSANQLKRSLKVAYKTAWYLCHRIRKALQTPSALMRGVVEIDETYVGGKVRGKGKGYVGNKASVVGAVERGGKISVQTVPFVDRNTLREFIEKTVCPDAEAIFTDENPSYHFLKGTERYHDTVNHRSEEWIRGDVHTNSVESAWSLFKRSVVGAYHKVSHKHLDLYLDEFEFKFNNRDNPFIFRDALKEILTAEHLEFAQLVA